MDATAPPASKGKEFQSMENTMISVDGSEIWRSPVEGKVAHLPLFTGFYASQVVVWDFFRQQYLRIIYETSEYELRIMWGNEGTSKLYHIYIEI